MYAHAGRAWFRQRRTEATKRIRIITRRSELSRAARHGLTHVCVCVALFCVWSTPKEIARPEPARALAVINDATLDAILQSAATDALGAREGAIIVLDPQTGRVRASVDPRLAS